MAILPEHVEAHVAHRHRLHLPPHVVLGRESHALLDLLEARPSVLIQGHDLAVQDHLARPEGAAHGMDLWISPGDVLAGPADEPDAAAVDVRERSDAVPLELKAPRSVRSGDPGRRLGHHRLDPLGHGLALRILRWIHPVDHPVVAAGLEEDVAALHPLALELEHNLTLSPLDGLVGAPVPDRHSAPAVLALRALPGELEFLERVDLD